MCHFHSCILKVLFKAPSFSADRPKLECDARWSAKIGSKDVRIACRGRMHPGPTLSSFSYGEEEDGTHEVIQVGEKFNNLSVEQTVSRITPKVCYRGGRKIDLIS